MTETQPGAGGRGQPAVAPSPAPRGRGPAVLRLWRGEEPLARAFWDWGILGGLVVNMSTSFAFWLLLTEDRVVSAYLIGYGLSNAYNLLIGVGIWRTVGREVTDPARARRIRLITLALLSVAVVT
ncbi:MAG: hypothetical protein NZ523_09375 [Elioraea sp.]|nr:hypothetical protein [Elioraea sp.]